VKSSHDCGTVQSGVPLACAVTLAATNGPPPQLVVGLVSETVPSVGVLASLVAAVRRVATPRPATARAVASRERRNLLSVSMPSPIR
jgi:hypothetical protein